MIAEYLQAREKFLKELRFIFPHSTNLLLEVNVDNIALKDFDAIPTPHKEESLADGAIKWVSAAVVEGNDIDTFNSEYL